MKNPIYHKLLRRNLEKLSTPKHPLETVSDKDFTALLTGSHVIVDDDGKPVIVYLEVEDNLGPLSIALQHVEYQKSSRTSGLPSNSRIFGYSPRIAIRRDFCGAASINQEDPMAYAAIKAGAVIAAGYYTRFNLELFNTHMKMADRVPDVWRMGLNYPFTSGIINKNNQLRYHHDAGNFKNVWSAMFVFKKDVEGGYLSVPEFDVGFELKNNSLLLFDGQSILHGVTPIKMLSPASFRISIVYYSLAGMWKCLSPEQELARIRKVKTEREKRRDVK